MGAGAGALVLRPRSDDPAATIDSVGQATTGFLERHREHGQSAEQGIPGSSVDTASNRP